MITHINYCECSGKHEVGCYLGIRLKIKYHPAIQRVWDLIGAKETEELIDEIHKLVQ